LDAIIDILSLELEKNFLTPLEAVGEYPYRTFPLRRKRAPLPARSLENGTQCLVAVWL